MKHVICKCNGDMTTMFVSTAFVLSPGRRIQPGWYYRCTEISCNNILHIEPPEPNMFPPMEVMVKHPEFKGAHHFHHCGRLLSKNIFGHPVYCQKWTTGHRGSWCPPCQRKVAAQRDADGLNRKEEYASSTSHTESGRLGS